MQRKIPKIKPMLATLTDRAFDSKDYIFEIKWDGYRALAQIEKGRVELYSRNLKDFNADYPSIVKLLGKVKDNVLFDGEIVAYGKAGISQFQVLQNLQSNAEARIEYVIFDLLYLNGKSLMELPLIKRKELLEQIVKKYSFLTLSMHVEKKGINFFNKSTESGLEGVIAKRKDSFYMAGVRTEDWLKIKNHKTDEAVIAGYTAPRGGRKYFGALVLGQYKENDTFTFIGHTGTGFNHETLQNLYKKMKPKIIQKSPFKEKVKLNAPITWVKPELVASLKFTEWTEGGNMRHPVFLGLREDKEAKQVKRERYKKL